MLPIIWAVIGALTGLFLRENRPFQIALAVSLGIMLGLIPKDNLIALILVLCLFLSYANLGVGILTAAVVSLISPQLDPFADRIGMQLLGQEIVLKIVTRLFEFPLFAWTSLNNSGVLGHFVIGLVTFFPVFLIVLVLCRLLKPAKKAESLSKTVPVKSKTGQPV